MAGRTAACEHPRWKEAKTRSLVWGAAATGNLTETLTKDRKMRTERPGVKWMRAGLGAASLLAAIWFAPVVSAQEPQGASGSDVAETGKKLSNPLSDVWALFSRFDANFADGNVNQGDAKVGSMNSTAKMMAAGR